MRRVLAGPDGQRADVAPPRARRRPHGRPRRPRPHRRRLLDDVDDRRIDRLGAKFPVRDARIAGKIVPLDGIYIGCVPIISKIVPLDGIYTGRVPSGIHGPRLRARRPVVDVGTHIRFPASSPISSHAFKGIYIFVRDKYM